MAFAVSFTSMAYITWFPRLPKRKIGPTYSSRIFCPQCCSKIVQQQQQVQQVQQVRERGTRQRSAKHERRRAELNSYRSRFTRALEAELAEEMATMKERVKNWSKKRLEAEGLGLFDLSVRPDGHLYGDAILRFSSNSQPNGFLPPHHQFSHGDVIAISRRNPFDDADSTVEGVVMERARRFLRVAISSKQAGSIDQRLKWRLDLSANRVAFERCLWAVNAFTSPEIPSGSGRRPSADLLLKNPSSKKGVSGVGMPDSLPTVGEGLMSFRDVILAAETSNMNTSEFLLEEDTMVKSENSKLQPSPPDAIKAEGLSKMSTPPSRVSGSLLGAYKKTVASYVEEDLGTDVNSSQKIAIRNAMCRRMTLWQGPPGTGKTRTLVRLIKCFCKHGGQDKSKVLACADSNVAVDNLVEGLLEQGLKVVRVGQPVKVKDELRDSTVAAQVSAHPLMKKAQQYRLEAMSKRKEVRQINNEKKRKAGAIQATAVWEKASDLEKAAVRDVLGRADVVAATCVGAGDPILDGWQFWACVIDEATQATEPSSLIPILRSGADNVVLVGDPAQLPPTVVSQDAMQEGLSRSLFERLQQECGLDPLLLDTQYRMHPFLAAWPSAMFYKGELRSQVRASDRPLPKGLLWPKKSKPLIFVNCAHGTEERTAFGNSWFNRSDAVQVVQAVKLLLSSSSNNENRDVRCIDIGVISPYSAQVRLLQDLFTEAEGGGALHGGTFADIEVKTVDGFQGREKEVMVISTVRSNSDGRLGFVTDPRRMNVALTRAKRGLVVVGNSNTLQSCYVWRQWLQMVKSEGIYVESSAF